LEGRDFLMGVMISRPPADSEDGVIAGNDAIKEMPATVHRRLWISIDEKLRSA
jgi:hypothetical protein